MDWLQPDAWPLASVMGSIKIAHKGGQNHQPSREEIARRFAEAFRYVL